jgi:hypothetical protein
MRRPHTVTEEDLSDYVETQRHAWTHFAVSSGNGSLKKLEFCFGGIAPIYRVTCSGKEIYVGALKETAVREYNALSWPKNRHEGFSGTEAQNGQASPVFEGDILG